MKLSNNLYDILKWISILGLPAVGACYLGLSQIWGLPYGNEVVNTCAVLGTFLGAILGISNANYKSEAENNTYIPPQDFVNHEIVEEDPKGVE